MAESSKLYISAIGTMSVTISGCPSLRSQFFERSSVFNNLQRKEIAIRGPYHASHLYSNSDVEDVLGSDVTSLLNRYTVIRPIVGLTSKSPVSALQLFQDAVLEILAHQVQWDRLVKICAKETRASKKSTVRVLAMGPTALANSLISALKVGGGLKLSLEDCISWSAQNKVPIAKRNSTNSKIAIIGMAGRFPDAADDEAFWKLLEQGLDVHRQVMLLPFDHIL